MVQRRCEEERNLEKDNIGGLAGNSAFHIIGRNLARTAGVGAAAMERRLAHIREQSDLIARRIESATGEPNIIKAILTSEEAVSVYRTSVEEMEKGGPLFDPVNGREEPYFREQMNRFDKFYRCRQIVRFAKEKPKLRQLIPWVCGELADIPSARDKRVAFLRNGQASRAFERFARYLGGVSAVYEDNFQNACESVYIGQATYAVIPISNTTDGRLNSFYRQLEKYELDIALTCEIDSDDGENATTFALVYKERLYLQVEGLPLYECKITFDDVRGIAELFDAAFFFGATVESVEALPLLFSGRERSFSVIFGLQGVEPTEFFCYLALEYPQTTSLGIYTKIEGGAR